MINFIKQKNNSQSGVTLLVSILVMSGLALISLSVAAFAIQELRSSRAVLVTEPAISAAETAGEQGIWAIKRGTALTNCDPDTGLPPVGTPTNALANGARVNSCRSFSNATFDLAANTPFVFFLYDPNNINGDVDLLAYPYSALTLIHKAGLSQVTINITRLDGTAVGAQPVTVAPGATGIVNIPAVFAGSEGRMKVVLQSAGNATVIVDTNKADGTSLGLPNFPSVNAAGCASRSVLSDCESPGGELFNRRIKITVPQ